MECGEAFWCASDDVIYSWSSVCVENIVERQESFFNDSLEQFSSGVRAAKIKF